MLKTITCTMRPQLNKPRNIRQCTTGSQNQQDEKEKELERIAREAVLEQPPTTCCQSGCATCVYIAWADALAARIGRDPNIAHKILQHVEDPSMKAFLQMELRLRGFKE